LNIGDPSLTIQALISRGATRAGYTPGESLPGSEEGESFQRSVSSPPQLMKNLSSVSASLFAPGTAREAWTFKAESTCILVTHYAPGGKLLCQDQGKVYCLDGKTGAKEWKLTKERGGMATLTTAPDGTAYLDEVVNNAIVAVDTATGKEKWRAGMLSSSTHNDVVPSSGGVFTGALTSEGKEMVKVVRRHDPATGAISWEKKLRSNLSSPMKLSDDGKNLLVNLSDRLTVLDPATGDSRWSFPSKDMENTVPSMGPQGTVYYRGKDSQIHALDGATGKPLWKYPVDEDSFGMPRMDGKGNLYAQGKGKLAALDGRDGKVKWEIGTAGMKIADVKVSADGKVHLFDRLNSTVLVVDAETGAPRSKGTCRKDWMMAELSPDGILYYAEGDKIRALRLDITEERLKEMAQSAAAEKEGSAAAEVEISGGYIMIDGVRIPVNDGAAAGKSFYLL